MEKSFVIGNVGHAGAKVDIADAPVESHDTVQRHAPQFENINLLFIALRCCVIRVGQAYERYFFRFPIETKCTEAIRTHSQDFCTATCELIVFITQAR